MKTKLTLQQQQLMQITLGNSGENKFVIAKLEISNMKEFKKLKKKGLVISEQNRAYPHLITFRLTPKGGKAIL